MAYRAFDAWPDLAEAQTNLNTAAHFDAVELNVLKLARRDRSSSLGGPGLLSALAGLLFGLRRANSLANPRLEALRRVAVQVYRNGRAKETETDRLLAAGYSPLHLHLIERFAAPALSSQR